MKSTLLLLLSLGLVLLTTPAHANLCDSVKDRVTTGDTKGNDIAKVTASAGNNADKQTLKSRDLEPKVIRGHSFLIILDCTPKRLLSSSWE